MRNRFFWLLAIIIMCGAIMTGLTSCSDNDDNSSNNQKKVAVLLPDASSLDRWAIDKSNLETVMAAYGFKTTFYVAPETAEGAVQQVDQLRNAIKDGVKYIVLTAIDYKKINESGLLEQHPDVKVVCHDRFVLDNPRIAYVSSTDTKEIGRTQAMFLLNHYHSSGASSMTIEFLEGPQTDVNAKDYYEGAMELLKKYIDSGKLVVQSGKKEYSQVKSDSWTIADGKKAMQDRLGSYGTGECPDMILAANDNLAQGAIEALAEAGVTGMPVITGQDNTAMAQTNIKNGKQTMTIDKNLRDMAYNTAMIINSLISNSPVHASQSISDIPVFYSKITLMTQDSY
ncbi:MAG: substrate-binding domain-containing protein [Bacteroidaceae bacterium]|nr:substrate-binding domain-containing protein [Bacteroidaceae bacterium]